MLINGAPAGCRLGGVHLDAAEVLGADVAVLGGADQSGRRAVVAVERAAVEVVGDEHAVGTRVPECDDGPVAVEATKHDVGDHGVGPEGWCDDATVEGLERDPFPVQIGG